MAEKFIIKQNDTSPRFKYDLDLYEGQTLIGATVQFHMAELDGTIVVDAPGIVFDETEEVIQYDWAPADTATAGVYKAEFEVTFDDGTIETYPNDGFILVRISPDLS